MGASEVRTWALTPTNITLATTIPKRPKTMLKTKKVKTAAAIPDEYRGRLLRTIESLISTEHTYDAAVEVEGDSATRPRRLLQDVEVLKKTLKQNTTDFLHRPKVDSREGATAFSGAQMRAIHALSGVLLGHDVQKENLDTAMDTFRAAFIEDRVTLAWQTEEFSKIERVIRGM